MTARNDVLGAIRRRLGRTGPPDGRVRPALRRRIEEHRRGPVPAALPTAPEERIARFTAMAELAAATVARVGGPADAPASVRAYLAENGLSGQAIAASQPALAAYPWAAENGLALRRGPPRAETAVAVTDAVAGVAETGSLLVRAGEGVANALHFLADTHIALLPASRVVGAYEDAIDLLRADLAARGEAWPRAVGLITGPSRTSDIERVLVIGAHGPRRLHIVLVGV